MRTTQPWLLIFTTSCLLFHLVAGNAGVFTYYEAPMFARIGNKGYVMAREQAVGAGPSQWRNILFPPIVAPTGNQCGGMGQRNGYGQSPIVIPAAASQQCDTSLGGYEFESGTCAFDQLAFNITTNGVITGPAPGETCSLGRMKIPGNDNWFNALQFHIHTGSEHSVQQGDNNSKTEYYAAELHVVHAEETGESFAVFGMFIDEDPTDATADNEQLEPYLQGWEATALRAEQFCSVRPQGTGIWGPLSVFESQQKRLTCPAPGSTVDPSTVEWDDELDLPVAPQVDFPEDVPHIYQDLPTAGYGVYAYRGGLTTPPCTEIVNWNLLDVPLYASRAQIDRLYNLVLCMTETSLCKHATIANEVGLTNRPVQDLNGRTVLHRCSDGPDADGAAVAVPLAPQYEYVQTQTRRCVVGGDGGPLMMCWVDTLMQHFAILYPWFVMLLGLVTFYLLSRFASWLPYTACLFLLGVVMGVFSVTHDATDQLSSSFRMWQDIGAEILLLGFLPGLLFRDSYTSNVFLFQKAFYQCVVMAFPMVLAGTCLTALVGFYILPYDWSWALSMTFGAILSATDPVAVSALLNEVGAPPRLKTHISGESLLNDGSAIVFFTIFSQIFEFELGIPGFGTDIDLATGVALFFRMSLGAAAIGLLFSAGLLGMIFLLNRQFNYEESIVQVTASVTAAYLCYYTAEAVLGMSGVIAVVTLGVMTKFFSSSLINDTEMMEKFWVMLEHILNSLLFNLGGMVWGRIVSGQDPEHKISFEFTASDYGYIVLVFVLLLVIRLFLMVSFYPIISRIGLGTNWKEALFMSWGGLRGAVGIALAIHLDKHITHQLFRTDPRRQYTTQLMAIVGGVSLLTLCVNGTLAGPMLKKLGLTKLGKARQAITSGYHDTIRKRMFTWLLCMLGEERYSGVDVSVMMQHISHFEHLTPEEIKYAVKSHKELTPILEYKEPNLSTLKPYLSEEEFEDIVNISKVNISQRLRAAITMASMVSFGGDKLEVASSEQETESEKSGDELRDELLMELRMVFIELMERAYEDQYDKGEIDVRNFFLVIVIKTATETTRDHVANGHPIGDWQVIANMLANKVELFQKVGYKKKRMALGDSARVTLDNKKKSSATARDLVHFSSAFVEAHQRAQKAFKTEFCSGRLLSDEEIQVLDESQKQIELAEESINMLSRKKIDTILAHLCSTILLHKAADYVGQLNRQGLLHDQEAEHYVEEIEHDIHRIDRCRGHCRVEATSKDLPEDDFLEDLPQDDLLGNLPHDDFKLDAEKPLSDLEEWEC